jgi:hypothetical protein
MSIKEWWSQKVKGDRTESKLTGGGDPRVTGDPAYKEVDADTLKVARVEHAAYPGEIGFKSKKTYWKDDPFKFIYDRIALREHHNIDRKSGEQESILMNVNLYERAQWLRQMGSTGTHRPEENRFYAHEIAELLEQAVQRWGPVYDNKILDIDKVKADLEQMSFERSAAMFTSKVTATATTRLDAAKKYIALCYSDNPVKQAEEMTRLRSLSSGKDAYSVSRFDALQLCKDDTGTAWRSYRGAKPSF